MISSWPKGTGGAGTMEKLQGSKGAQFSPAACLSQKVFLLSNPICAEWQQVKWEDEKESQCLKMSFSAVSHTLGEVTGLREVHVGHVYFLLGILLPEPKGEWESLSEFSLLADCGRTGHALLLLGLLIFMALLKKLTILIFFSSGYQKCHPRPHGCWALLYHCHFQSFIFCPVD